MGATYTCLAAKHQIHRVDTQRDTLSLESVEVAAVPSGGVGYCGVGFDGRYVIYTPGDASRFLRYDTTRPFMEEGFQTVAWGRIGLGLSPTSEICGAAFDGRYMHWASSDGQVMRYDTGSPSAPVPPVLGVSSVTGHAVTSNILQANGIILGSLQATTQLQVSACAADGTAANRVVTIPWSASYVQQHRGATFSKLFFTNIALEPKKKQSKSAVR
eukprot:TRINITY_DN5649_c0_g2_i3.p1 TRINITY_DN5649_c0_g2~~TRINITY_DN5649_c0_g2_i3.p1  ORF type:complete len:215 (+),score=24.55 TRINITY_DN5649_c0_g2_i3:508-1152(+)